MGQWTWLTEAQAQGSQMGAVGGREALFLGIKSGRNVWKVTRFAVAQDGLCCTGQ
jgi:hypothetical protein